MDMNKKTIIAASVGAVTALAVAYTMNSAAFGYPSPREVAAENAARTSVTGTSSPVRVAAVPAGATPPQAVNSTSVAAASSNMIRAGQVVSVKIGTHVSSRNAKVGDPVEAVTTEDLSANGKVVIASGSRVKGTVAEVQSAKQTKSAAVLRILFSRIGAYPARLALASPDLVDRARRANQAVDAGLVTGGAVAGGVIGNQVTHKKGTEVGAVAGAVVGAVAAANVGANVQLKLGEAGTVRFENDLILD